MEERNNNDSTILHTATFGAGCFWGVEEGFRNIKGVKETVVGYMGGSVQNPTYAQICMGNTGYAEVVHIQYDPKEITYEALLNTFWEMHDPTTPNRQGPDIGTQYRSVIFFHTLEQEQAARASKEVLTCSGKYVHPVVTEIVPAQTFWRAEEYHQRYFEKNGGGTCHI
ncbi:MAG: peptide-methionine (S)-S-oxide reductase [Parcubacteria group bacterium Gr01-1014_66]|nr:MAG: peptide-methionine (S)-S-oxide reductase [Parcubacteria group bacterium Gr01-1014_66]